MCFVLLYGILSETFLPAPLVPVLLLGTAGRAGHGWLLVRPAQLHLLSQVVELQEQVTAQCQEHAILQRSLQDRAAEVEVERMGAKVGV